MCAEHSLAGLLMCPVARLPQYLIFLAAIYQGMDPNTTGAEQLQIAIRAIQGVTDEIAFSLRDQVARKLVVTVQQKVFGGKVDLISPHRYVVKHGNLRMIFPKSIFTKRFRDYIFILFNDCILYGTRPGSLFSGTPKRVHKLKGVAVTDVADDVDYKYAFRIASDPKTKDSGAKFDLLVSAPSLKDKEKWMHEIQQEVLTHVQNGASLATVELSSEELENIVFMKKKTKDPVGPLSTSMTPSLQPSSTYSALPSVSNNERPSLPRSGSGSITFMSPARHNPLPPPQLSQHSVNEQWTKKWDAQYSEWYYENKDNGESQWEKPGGWVDDGPKPPALPTISVRVPLKSGSSTPSSSHTTTPTPPAASTPHSFNPPIARRSPASTPLRRASTSQIPDSAKKIAISKIHSNNKQPPLPPMPPASSSHHPPASHPSHIPPPPSPAPTTPAQRKSISFFTKQQIKPPPPGPEPPRGPPPPGPPPPGPPRSTPPPPPPPDSPSAANTPDRIGGAPPTRDRNPPPPPELDYPDPMSPETPSSPDIDESPPDAPPMDAPPMDAPKLEAPPLIFPSGPPKGKGQAGDTPVTPPSPAPATNGVHDLLSSIRNVDKGALRKTPAVPTPSGGRKASTEGGLGAALKQSLDRYRQFVQDDEDDIDAAGGVGGDGDDEWDP